MNVNRRPTMRRPILLSPQPFPKIQMIYLICPAHHSLPATIPIPNNIFNLPSASDLTPRLDQIPSTALEVRLLAAAQRANERVTMQLSTPRVLQQLRHPDLGDRDPCMYFTILECATPKKTQLNAIADLLGPQWKKKQSEIASVLAKHGAVRV